jgi:glycosyltransferase involved in cell wall biosynthesis
MGHDVRVAAIVDPPGSSHPFVARLREIGVPCDTIEVTGRAYGRERRLVGGHLASFAPHVLHTHGYRPDVVDAGIARRRRIPVVATVHGFTGMGWRGRLYEALQLLAFRRFDAVVAVSDPLARLLQTRGVPVQVLRTIVNAWRPMAPPVSGREARAVLGVPIEGRRVGWLGRLGREKGPDLFVELVARLDIPCSIVGEGPDRPALEARARELGLGKQLAWHGLVPNAGRLLRAFDVLVMTSRTEGTPLVLFEAMAAGVPIVATAVGGVPDVVGETEALLVPPEDAELLVAAVSRCLEYPQEAARRAASASRRLASRFSAQPWLDAYLALYRDLQRRR